MTVSCDNPARAVWSSPALAFFFQVVRYSLPACAGFQAPPAPRSRPLLAVRGGSERRVLWEAPQGRAQRPGVSPGSLRNPLPSAYTVASGGRKRRGWGCLEKKEGGRDGPAVD